MNAREQLQRLIDRKQQEIQELELQIEKAKTYMQAIQDSMRFLPKDNGQADASLRPGTALARVRDVLRSAGKPMHITDILRALELPIDKKQRLSLSGSLSSYVRNGQIFTRPAPNTFALKETDRGTSEQSAEIYDDLPDDFGADK